MSESYEDVLALAVALAMRPSPERWLFMLALPFLKEAGVERVVLR